MMEQVGRAQRIARDGLADTRRAISALRGDELPGPALLDRLVRDAAAATGVAATLSVTGPQRPLPPEVGLALYRTAQEALTNTAKYAGQGARAELRLGYADEAVELVIEDGPAGRPVAAGGRADVRRVRADRHARAGRAAGRQPDRRADRAPDSACGCGCRPGLACGPAEASPDGPVPGGPGDRGPVAEGYARNGSAS